MKKSRLDAQMLKKIVKPGIARFFQFFRPKTEVEAIQKELARGARLKAMLESGGFEDYTQDFIDQWLAGLLKIAADVESGRANPELLAAQIYGIVKELKSFTILQQRLSSYESTKAKVDEQKNLEQIQKRQAEFAR